MTWLSPRGTYQLGGTPKQPYSEVLTCHRGVEASVEMLTGMNRPTGLMGGADPPKMKDTVIPSYMEVLQTLPFSSIVKQG